MPHSNPTPKTPSSWWLFLKFITQYGFDPRAYFKKLISPCLWALTYLTITAVSLLSFIEMPVTVAVGAKSLGASLGLMSAGETYYPLSLSKSSVHAWSQALRQSDSKIAQDSAASAMESARKHAHDHHAEHAWIPQSIVQQLLETSSYAATESLLKRRSEHALLLWTQRLDAGDSDAQAIDQVRRLLRDQREDLKTPSLLSVLGPPQSCQGLELIKDFMPWMTPQAPCLGNEGRATMLAYWCSGLVLIFIGLISFALLHGLTSKMTRLFRYWVHHHHDTLHAQWELEQLQRIAKASSKHINPPQKTTRL